MIYCEANITIYFSHKIYLEHFTFADDKRLNVVEYLYLVDIN